LKYTDLNDLEQDQRRALEAAQKILSTAYSPYSHFQVGACLVMRDGSLVTGTNVENAAYGSTLCAERAALTRANVEGKRVFSGIAIIGQRDPGAPPPPAAKPRQPRLTGPCGSCRQMLYELAEVTGHKVDPRVVLSTPDKRRIAVTSVRRLMPYGFGPSNLDVDVSRWRA
jgi:cytidine deaminase